MTTDSRSTQQPVRPNYLQPTRGQKAAVALVAVLASCTVLGGTLVMFELRSNATAMARASIQTPPSTDEFAVRTADARARN